MQPAEQNSKGLLQKQAATGPKSKAVQDAISVLASWAILTKTGCVHIFLFYFWMRNCEDSKWEREEAVSAVSSLALKHKLCAGVSMPTQSCKCRMLRNKVSRTMHRYSIINWSTE